MQPDRSGPTSVSRPFLNWGARLGGLAIWLLLGLMPLVYDFFGVLPVPGLLARFDSSSEPWSPTECAGYTLAYVVLATVIYQMTVTPEARLDSHNEVLVVTGPVFTTTIALTAVDAVRVQAGVPDVAAAGRDIPVHSLFAPNIREFGPFKRRRQKRFREAVFAARNCATRPQATQDVTRSITGLAVPQIVMILMALAYVVWGLAASPR